MTRKQALAIRQYETQNENNTMNKVTEFNRQNLEAIRKHIQNSLDVAAEHFGITLKLGRIGFSNDNFKASLEAATIGNDGEANTREAQDYTRFAPSEGIAAPLGSVIRINGGKEHKLVGFRSRSPKMPFLAKSLADGRVFKLTPNGVKLGLIQHESAVLNGFATSPANEKPTAAVQAVADEAARLNARYPEMAR